MQEVPIRIQGRQKVSSFLRESEFYLAFVEYFLVLIATAIYIAVIYFSTPLLLPSDPRFVSGDHLKYISMADNPFLPVDAPFGYRLLVPWLVHLMPLDITTGFFLVTTTSLLLTGPILYAFFRTYASRTASFAGLTLYYSLEFGPRFHLFNFWLPDATAFLIVAICFWAIARSHWSVYAIGLVIGVLCKSVVLFTLPVYWITILGQKWERRSIVVAVLVSFTAVLVFAFVRTFVPVSVETSYNLLELLHSIGAYRIATLSTMWYRYTITTWGLILFVYPLFNDWRTLWMLVKRYGFFLILVYSQLLIAVNNERLLALGFVPVILASVRGFSRFQANRSMEISFALTSGLYFVYRLITNVPFDTSDPFIYHIGFFLVAFLFHAAAFLKELYRNQVCDANHKSESFCSSQYQ